jgi:hypothetical protein
MNRIITIFLVTIISTVFAVGQAADDKKAALAVVNQLFAEMAAANPAGILAIHTPTSDLAAVFKQKDGKSRYSSINGEKFSQMFTDKTKVMKEEMYDPRSRFTMIGRWFGGGMFSLLVTSCRTAE